MSRTPLKELTLNVLNQEANLLKSPAPLYKRTPAKSRYETTNRSITELNGLFPSREIALAKLVIKQQRREINKLRRHVAFLKLKYNPSRKQRSQKAIKQLAKEDIEGKFATPKKRKLLDENADVITEDNHQSFLPTNLPNPPAFSSPDRRVPFPPNIQEAKETEPTTKSIPVIKQTFSSPAIQFQELSKLLDGMEDETVLVDRKTEQLKKIYQTCSRTSPKPSRESSKFPTPPHDINDLHAEYLSPNYGLKKTAFLTNITKQYGPVSLAELPAYKDKINSWKHKYA